MPPLSLVSPYHQRVYISLHTHHRPIQSQQFSTMEEDYNELSEGRRVLLQRLATILGNVQPHFWAACQVADMENLALMVQMAELNRDVVWLAALNTSSMVAHCEYPHPTCFFLGPMLMIYIGDQRQPMETHGPQLPSPGSTSPSPSLIRSMGARYQVSPTYSA